MHRFPTHILVLMPAGIVAKLHPITPDYYIRLLRQLLRILSKIVSLHVKLAIECIQTSTKEMFHKQPVVIWIKNDCRVRHKLCTIFVYLSVAKMLEEHVRSSSYLLQVFFKENSHSHGKFTERLFLLQFLHTKTFEQIFLRTPICSW